MAESRFPPPERTVTEMIALGLHEPMVASVARLTGVEPTHVVWFEGGVLLTRPVTTPTSS